MASPIVDTGPHPSRDEPAESEHHEENGGLSAEEAERAAAWRRGTSAEEETAVPDSREPVASLRNAAAAEAKAFSTLAENVRDYAIFLMNPDGIITFWGEGARLIKWWTKDQAEGGHLRMLYPPGGSEDGTAEDHLRQARERGEYTGEGHRVRSDGSRFWAGITLTALRDESGELLGFAKVTRDLTARRAADALLQSAAASAEAARAEAVAASTAKSGFLATMSHEIRTPVNAILGYHELLDLEIDGPLTPGQRKHLERATASSRHLLQLISEVLDFSRIEADKAVVHRSAFRIGDAVAGALSLVAPQARARNLDVIDAVSGLAANLVAWGDEARVRQILVNLLANAIKFTESQDAISGESRAGGITLSAGTATEPSPDARLSGNGPWVYVRVEDTGVGIPREQIHEVFKPFVQADMALTRSHGGTGLGLAISRRLARLMDGDVTARSEVGTGSTFFLWLPAALGASLSVGGLEGAGLPRGDADPDADDLNRSFGAVADAILADLERILHAYVARLRCDPETPTAHSMEESKVEDHLASFLADLATTMTQLDLTEGNPTPELNDGTAIQRLVAERHGAQRARIGWSENELRREFAILQEELVAAVLRRAPEKLHGPDSKVRTAEAERALEVLRQFLGVAERLSIDSLRRASDKQSD